MRRAWQCGACRSELGRVRIGRQGYASLDLWRDAVRLVIPLLSRQYRVVCRCGSHRDFKGDRVQFVDRSKAA